MGLSYIEFSPTVSNTEWSIPNNGTTLTPVATAGVTQLWIDLVNLIAGDTFRLRLYEKTVSGGTQRQFEEWMFDGAQGVPGQLVDIGIVRNGWDLTLLRVNGSDRVIPCSIRQAS